jgi:DNA-binding MurR/RpiR family transcriptional regulator
VSRILQLVIIDILYVSIVLEMGPKAVERINRSRLAVAGKKR